MEGISASIGPSWRQFSGFDHEHHWGGSFAFRDSQSVTTSLELPIYLSHRIVGRFNITHAETANMAQFNVAAVAIALLLIVGLVRLLLVGRRPNGYPPGPPTIPLIGNIHQVCKMSPKCNELLLIDLM